MSVIYCYGMLTIVDADDARAATEVGPVGAPRESPVVPPDFPTPRFLRWPLLGTLS